MNKQEFKDKAKQSIDNIFSQIDELEAKKDQAKTELKDVYNKHISKLKSEKEELKSRYEKLVQTGDEKWDEAKESFEKASESFKSGIREVSSILSN